MTVAAYSMPSVTGIGGRPARRLRTGKRRVRMFGQTKGNRHQTSFAAIAARPVYLSGAAADLVSRVLDPKDAFGKSKPLPWPPGGGPAVIGAASTSG